MGAVACGGDEQDDSSDNTTFSQDEEAAATPAAGSFPAVEGRTLRQIANLGQGGPELAPATQHYSTGSNRFAFGLVAQAGEFIYGPTAVYVARSPQAPARGPMVAPTDSLVTDAAFRSKQAVLDGDALSSIYSTQIELPEEGPYSVLVLTQIDGQILGATTQIQANDRDPIPKVGDRAPVVETDTVDAAGQISEIETREPPDTMHEVDFADVAGERPVALLFATPALCSSRVCGPVTDIAEQLKQEYGDEVEFIHQEVYVDNDASKGIREPLQAFGLDSEPWLFTINADGKVVARLEGSFGVDDFRSAVEAAL